MPTTDQAESVKYRKALLWAFDRLTTSNLTQKEILTTAREIGKVLSGRPSPAAEYEPNEWDESAKLSQHLP